MMIVLLNYGIYDHSIYFAITEKTAKGAIIPKTRREI
jgi:hypothetical protein